MPIVNTMSLQNYNILIVEDDGKFGESVKQALTRAGFRAYHVATPADALSYSKLQDVHGLIVDCMLPKMNGLELVKQVTKQITADIPVILMSGIFKDKQFISSSMKKAGALNFFTKPFDLDKMVNSLKRHFMDEVTSSASELNPLVQLYIDKDMKPRKMIRLINGCEGLHNFELPWIFNLLIGAKATGHLNIICTNGDIAGVGFLDGKIVQVNIKNEESLMGLLLTEQGFIDKEDLDIAIENKDKTVLLGQYLVRENFVSPHSIDIVLKEQITWRLKRLVADSQMELNFVAADEVIPIVTLDHTDVQNFFIETLENVVRGDWLKTHYIPLMQNIVGFNEDNKDILSRVKANPFVARIFSELEGPLTRGTTIEELIGQHQSHEEVILKVMHFLNVCNCLKFTEVLKNANMSHQIKRLQKLDVELDDKNYFERLGLSRTAKDDDIAKAYKDLAKVLHPDKLMEGTPAKVRELSKKVFEKIQTAYDVLKKPDKKEHYLKELEVGQAEKLMQADQFLDQGRFFLLKGEYAKAKDLLTKAKDYNPDSTEIRILSIWIDIKQTRTLSDSFLKDIERRLTKIPIQARDSAAYYHTRGLYCALMEDTDRAKKYFKTALNMDQSFINSRRELSVLENNRKVNIFKDDLKTVVGSLFKRR